MRTVEINGQVIAKLDGDGNSVLRLALADLESAPTISVSQSCDLKGEGDGIRVWLSRCTVDDGEPYNNKVTVEVWDDEERRWHSHEYKAFS